jgi:hypothetical protein
VFYIKISSRGQLLLAKLWDGPDRKTAVRRCAAARTLCAACSCKHLRLGRPRKCPVGFALLSCRERWLIWYLKDGRDVRGRGSVGHQSYIYILYIIYIYIVNHIMMTFDDIMICQCLCSLSPCHLESWAWILYVQLIAGWCDAEQSCHLLYVVGTITVEVVTSKHLLYVLDMVKPCSFQRHLRVSSASSHSTVSTSRLWSGCGAEIICVRRLDSASATRPVPFYHELRVAWRASAAKMRPSGAWLQAPAQIPLDNAAIGTSAKERSFFEHFWTVLTTESLPSQEWYGLVIYQSLQLGKFCDILPSRPCRMHVFGQCWAG